MLPPYLRDVPSSGEGNQALGTKGSGLGSILYLKAGLSFTVTSHQKLGCGCSPAASLLAPEASKLCPGVTSIL